METIRHSVATVYVVNDGATALHEHERLGYWLPPGGHIGRDELPADAARREVREETGFDVTLVHDELAVGSPTVEERPRPARVLLEDIDRGDAVRHQHVDFVYVGHVPSREIRPADGETAADAWRWLTPAELRDGDFEPDVVDLGCEAIDRVENR